MINKSANTPPTTPPINAAGSGLCASMASLEPSRASVDDTLEVTLVSDVVIAEDVKEVVPVDAFGSFESLVAVAVVVAVDASKVVVGVPVAIDVIVVGELNVAVGVGLGVGLGVTLGVRLGVVLGVVLGVGVGFGVGFGVGIGVTVVVDVVVVVIGGQGLQSGLKVC